MWCSITDKGSLTDSSLNRWGIWPTCTPSNRDYSTDTPSNRHHYTDGIQPTCSWCIGPITWHNLTNTIQIWFDRYIIEPMASSHRPIETIQPMWNPTDTPLNRWYSTEVQLMNWTDHLTPSNRYNLQLPRERATKVYWICDSTEKTLDRLYSTDTSLKFNLYTIWPLHNWTDVIEPMHPWSWNVYMRDVLLPVSVLVDGIL
jgi:hypothetical protein